MIAVATVCEEALEETYGGGVMVTIYDGIFKQPATNLVCEKMRAFQVFGITACVATRRVVTS